MIRLNWLNNTEKLLKYGAIICGACAGLAGFLLTFPSKDYAQGIRQYILIANESTVWWSVPSLTVIAGIFTFFKTHFGTSNSWSAVTLLLEEYRTVIFQSREGFETDASHHNRVTLYKHVKWRWMVCAWPWKNWMVPVSRTGHTTQTWRIPRFLAPTGDPDNARGVAGQAFATNSTVIVPNLPEIGPSATNKSIKTYAKKGFVDEKWVRKKQKKGCSIRSLVGVPIEVKGKPWGSIVVDSRHPDAITDVESIQTPEFSRLARLLSKLLEN